MEWIYHSSPPFFSQTYLRKVLCCLCGAADHSRVAIQKEQVPCGCKGTQAWMRKWGVRDLHREKKQPCQSKLRAVRRQERFASITSCSFRGNETTKMKHEDLAGTERNLLCGYWFATDVLWEQRNYRVNDAFGKCA